jgi:HAD superfamily hydrolase (TIGR01509 family)
MTLQALIWDVDGTLAETEDDGHRVAFNRAFAEAGLAWRWSTDTYRELLAVTGGKERLLAWWRRVDPDGANGPPVAPLIRRLHERKTAHYLALLAGGAIGLRPGVAALLEAARQQGLRQAIATTTTPDNVTRLIDVTLGPDGHSLFEVIGAGDVVPAKKPAPDIYRWVLARLALAPADCLAIEDSAAGVAAARAAGLPVLLTRGVYTADEAIQAVLADPTGPGPVLADLDGLGSTKAPARGRVGAQPWAGVADLDTVRAWWSARRTDA